MRPLTTPRLERLRVAHPLLHDMYGGPGNPDGGAFYFPVGGSGNGQALTMLSIIATRRSNWDHISVSLPDRCPMWEEMEAVKRAFFFDDECAMQLHVPVADHISIHPFALHLWRPHPDTGNGTIPMPPKEMI